MLQKSSHIGLDDLRSCAIRTEKNEIFVGRALLLVAKHMSAALRKGVLLDLIAELIPPVISVSLLTARVDDLDRARVHHTPHLNLDIVRNYLIRNELHLVLLLSLCIQRIQCF